MVQNAKISEVIQMRVVDGIALAVTDMDRGEGFRHAWACLKGM